MRIHIVFISFCFGLLVWIADALIDSIIFYKVKFLDSLILDLPPHELYMRSLVLVSFIIFGIIASRFSKEKEVIKQSESKWTSLVENAPHIIAVINKEGIIQFINKTVSGFTAQGTIGTSIYQYINRDFHDLAKKTIQDVFKSGNPGMYENTGVGPDGTISWYEVQVGPVKKDNEVVAATMFITDITHRKKTEKLLEKEKDRIQEYLKIVEVLLVIITKDGTIEFINRKACDVLGYTESELIGKDWFETCLPERLRKSVKEVFITLMAGETSPVEFYENPVLCKDGKEKLVAWHNTVLRDDSGKITGTLSSGEDMTERKK